jgi:four helix bundle suffix protein
VDFCPFEISAYYFRELMSENLSDGSVGSDRSDGFPGQTPSRLRPSGGYRTLRSFRVTTIIYDTTVSFCERFMDKRSRTVDQMVQAARSGRQNIAEGSRASATSSQTELRLVNVARASLDELLLDYEDYLRQRGKRQWGKADPEALAVRRVGQQRTASVGNRTNTSDQTDPSDSSDAAQYFAWLNHPDPVVVANCVICLIHQANYLLDQQLRAIEGDFVSKGGYSENLATARIVERQRQSASGKEIPSTPTCPLCSKPMAVRTARQGTRSGSQFWGCSCYPICKGTRKME